MADLQVKAVKLLLHNVLRNFRDNGTSPAEADAPVVRPELAKTHYGDYEQSDID
jgi:hypothetical protein